MQPGRIGDEYYLTRGHIHATGNRPEIYYGEAGQGLMLMESPEGETRIVEISPRVMCYVPPFWIHRAINVGQDALVMTFMYPERFRAGLRRDRTNIGHAQPHRGKRRALERNSERGLPAPHRRPNSGDL